jgi:hypothetical protein
LNKLFAGQYTSFAPAKTLPGLTFGDAHQAR